MRTGSSPSVVDPDPGGLRDSAASTPVDVAFPHGRVRCTAFQRHRGLTRSGGLRG